MYFIGSPTFPSGFYILCDKLNMHCDCNHFEITHVFYSPLRLYSNLLTCQKFKCGSVNKVIVWNSTQESLWIPVKSSSILALSDYTNIILVLLAAI